MTTPEKTVEYMRAYRLAHKLRLSDAAKAYRKKHDPKEWSKKNRASHLKTKYGLTVSEYDALLKSQAGSCAICKTTNWTNREPHVDHDHKTGRVRGILCPTCNAAIGFIKENPIIAWAMADYLQKRCNRKAEFMIDYGTAPLGTQSLATLLRVSTKTIYRWCHKRGLPFVHAGCRKVFLPAELKAWAVVND
jgi:excisionase family DNA binding protein